jgi:hypothetical protein
MLASFCSTCRLRRRYDAKPHSLLGRFWRWHTSWCPGWRAYLASLPADERERLQEHYGLRK